MNKEKYIIVVYSNGLNYDEPEILTQKEWEKVKNTRHEYQAGPQSWRTAEWQELFEGSLEECEKFLSRPE